MRRVIITGATGSIGVALVQELINRNVEVLVLVRKNSPRFCNIPVHPLVTVMECPLESLAELQNDTGVQYDVFYHFGWAGTTGEARNDMQLQVRNVQYTLDAVAVAERFGCSVFIGAGSQAEYGRVEGILTGSTPTFPENGYGIGKLCAGQMSRILCEQKGIRHIWMRILSVYGPFDNSGSMIMSTIRKLLNGEIPALTKGEQQWDYLYSADAARAFVLLADKGKAGKVYCLGSGKALPLLYYVEKLRDAVNAEMTLGVGEIPYASKQVMYLCADISELTKDTGFVPSCSFETGIKNTIEWYKEDSDEKNKYINSLL